MPLYFFNVYDGIDRHDTVGTKLTTRREVRHHMLSLGAKMLQDGDIPPDGWRMEVLDEAGTIVFTMHFGEEPEDA